MALGTVTIYPSTDVKSIVLLASTTSTNGPPSGAAAGLSMIDLSNLFGFMPSEVGLLLYSTAGSGVMTVTARLWGYHPSPAAWFPLGAGGDATKGVINAGAAIGEINADAILHCETVALIGVTGSRIYLEVTAIGGTATAVAAELVAYRAYQ